MSLQGRFRVFHRFVLVLAVLQAGVLTACTTSKPRPPVTINAKVHDSAATISRVLVLAGPKITDRLEDRDGPLALSFPSHIEALLAQCGVHAIAFRQDDLPNLEEPRVAEARARLRPDAILAITPMGGRVVHVTESMSAQLQGHRFLDLELVSAESGQPIWTAKARFEYQGMPLAQGIVTRLRDDGVLRRCPPGELVPRRSAPTE